MKILKHTPPTITVSLENGSVLVYNLDEIRRKAIYDDKLMEVLGVFLEWKIEQRNK